MTIKIEKFKETIMWAFGNYTEAIDSYNHHGSDKNKKVYNDTYEAFATYRNTAGNKINSLLETTHDLSGIISPTSQEGGSAHNSTCNCNQCSATYRKKYLKYKKKYLEYK
jgi:hypothetical protein